MESKPVLNGSIIQGYKIIKFLGKGKFSDVYQAERQLDSKLVALKIIKIYDIMDKETVQKCLQEVDLLKRVSHPNIVKYFDSFISNNELYIAIEWADKGDVKKLIKKFKQEGDQIDEVHVIEYVREIASALQHMHEQRVIHRDLKPANILIFSDGTFKLGDLGLGRSLSKETIKAFSRVGTPLYMAPEVINNKGYDFKSDNWSLGCVVYELVTLRSPFQINEKISVMDLFKVITLGQYKEIDDPKYKTAKIIVNGLIKINPNERLDLKDVIKICNDYLSKVEEKPRFDPFIIMDDINEKLRLLNYENNFCKKFNKEIINKYYFAINIYGYDYNNENNSLNENYPVQFSYFYDLSNWLISLIKKNVNLNIIQELEIKIKKYDKKKSHEQQMNELIEDLKSIDVKVLLNSKFKYGYGDGVCLVLTQLCDKYLIKGGFKNNITSTKTKFFQGIGIKRFNSYSNNDDVNTAATEISVEDENYNNVNNIKNNILISGIEQSEWNKEFKRVENILEIPVENILEIPEAPEIFEQSESSNNNNINNNNNNDNEKSIIKRLYNFNVNFDNNFYFIQGINDYNEGIEKELKKINQIESSLGNNEENKSNLSKLKLTQNAVKHYKEDIDNVNDEIESLKKEKERIIHKINKLNALEKNELSIEDKNKLKDIKENINKLKNETLKYNSEESILNAALMNLNKNENTNLINNNINKVLFSKNENDENEQIFSNDEII